MRVHRFVLLKPLVLLAVVPLERSLCKQACDTMPGAWLSQTVQSHLLHMHGPCMDLFCQFSALPGGGWRLHRG